MESNESSWLWRTGFRRLILYCFVRKFCYLPKLGYFFCNLVVPNSRLTAISPRQVDSINFDRTMTVADAESLVCVQHNAYHTIPYHIRLIM